MVERNGRHGISFSNTLDVSLLTVADSRGSNSAEREKKARRFLQILFQRGEYRSTDQEAICARILSALNSLTERRTIQLQSLGAPVPDEFEFDESELAVADAELRHPEDPAFYTMPGDFYETAFERLVELGELKRVVVPEVGEEGRAAGYLFTRNKTPRPTSDSANT